MSAERMIDMTVADSIDSPPRRTVEKSGDKKKKSNKPRTKKPAPNNAGGADDTRAILVGEVDKDSYLTPKQIVSELDKYIVGQDAAKKRSQRPRPQSREAQGGPRS